MSLHSDTLFWFRVNQSLLLLIIAACLTEKQQIPVPHLEYFSLTRPGLEAAINRTRGEVANYYTTDAVISLVSKQNTKTNIHDNNV